MGLAFQISKLRCHEATALRDDCGIAA